MYIKTEEIVGPILSGSACKLLNFLDSWVKSILAQLQTKTEQQPKFLLERYETESADTCLRAHIMIPFEADLNAFLEVTKAFEVNIHTDGCLIDNVNYFQAVYGDKIYEPTGKEMSDGYITDGVHAPVDYYCEYQDQSLIDILPSLREEDAKKLAEIIFPVIQGEDTATVWVGNSSSDDVIEDCKITIALHFLPDVSYAYDIAEAIAIFGEKEVMAYLRQKMHEFDEASIDIEDLIEDSFSSFALGTDDAKAWQTIDEYLDTKQGLASNTEVNIASVSDEEEKATKEPINLEGIEVIDA